MQTSRFTVPAFRRMLRYAILAAILVVVLCPGAVAQANDEREALQDSCGRCHGHPERLPRDSYLVHGEHTAAECQTCHIGDATLESAHEARGAIRWVALGAVALMVAGLGINYVIVTGRTRREASS